MVKYSPSVDGGDAQAGATARVEVVVCVNRRANPARPSCGARGGESVAHALERAAAGGNGFRVVRIHCFGQCEHGPNVRIAPGGAFFHHVDAAAVGAIAAAARAAR